MHKMCSDASLNLAKFHHKKEPMTRWRYWCTVSFICTLETFLSESFQTTTSGARLNLSISRSAQLLGFSRTAISIGFTKNGVKREKHPVWGSPVGENALFDARG